MIEGNVKINHWGTQEPANVAFFDFGISKKKYLHINSILGFLVVRTFHS